MRPPPAADGGNSFVFDLKNGLRVWLSEAVKRGEVKVEDAEASIRRIDPAAAIDFVQDYIKLLTGTVKDSFGTVGIASKLVKDSASGGECGYTSSLVCTEIQSLLKAGQMGVSCCQARATA